TDHVLHRRPGLRNGLARNTVDALHQLIRAVAGIGLFLADTHDLAGIDIHDAREHLGSAEINTDRQPSHLRSSPRPIDTRSAPTRSRPAIRAPVRTPRSTAGC